MKYSLAFLITTLILCFGCAKIKNPEVSLSTGYGDIILEIYTGEAPVTACHFMKYVEEGRFRGATFYRSVRHDNQSNPVKIEVLQGGLEYTAIRDTLDPIRHETTMQTGIHHLNGTISMARFGPGTANSEFFICIGDQPSLDYGGQRNPDGQGFAAFGRVIEGMDVVKKIASLPTSGDFQKLNDPVRIDKIEFFVK